MDLATVQRSAKIFFKKNGTRISTAMGIGLGITTTIAAVKATPKAIMLIEERKLDLEVEKLDPVETVKTVWPCYIWPAVTGAMSIACLIWANSADAKRNAALMTAYTLSETALKEYKEKVVETLGEKKEKSVRDAIAKDRIEKNPPKSTEIVITGKGSTRCYEPLSGRYFESDIEKIKKAVNEINRRLLYDNHICLNEFYEEIGLDDTQIGFNIGWRIDKGYLELDFSSQLDRDGVPCLVLDFTNPPQYGYDSFL